MMHFEQQLSEELQRIQSITLQVNTKPILALYSFYEKLSSLPLDVLLSTEKVQVFMLDVALSHFIDISRADEYVINYAAHNHEYMAIHDLKQIVKHKIISFWLYHKEHSAIAA